MAGFKSFEEIDAWQKARDLTNEIYTVTRCGLFSKDYGLRDQIQRASVSIMSNIAEGFERKGVNEFVHFLSIAKGSAGEGIRLQVSGYRYQVTGIRLQVLTCHLPPATFKGIVSCLILSPRHSVLSTVFLPQSSALYSFLSPDFLPQSCLSPLPLCFSGF